MSYNKLYRIWLSDESGQRYDVEEFAGSAQFAVDMVRQTHLNCTVFLVAEVIFDWN